MKKIKALTAIAKITLDSIAEEKNFSSFKDKGKIVEQIQNKFIVEESGETPSRIFILSCLGKLENFILESNYNSINELYEAVKRWVKESNKDDVVFITKNKEKEADIAYDPENFFPLIAEGEERKPLNHLFGYIPILDVVGMALKTKQNLWLYGPTGSGKSSGIEYSLNRLGHPFERVNCNGESSIEDLIGRISLEKDGGTNVTVVLEGALQRCMQQGKCLIIDEIDTAAPEIIMVLQRVLENDYKSVFYDTRSNKEFIAEDGFIVFATSNTAGFGDNENIFAGTVAQNSSFRDRFIFKESFYDQNVERALIHNKTLLNDRAIDLILSFVNDCRTAWEQGKIKLPVTTRGVLQLAKILEHEAYETFSTALSSAIGFSIINKAASEEDKYIINSIAQHVFDVNVLEILEVFL